jgi:hypothetical protein
MPRLRWLSFGHSCVFYNRLEMSVTRTLNSADPLALDVEDCSRGNAQRLENATLSTVGIATPRR